MARRVPIHLVACVVAVLAAHIVTATNYGWFRDELYYVACGRRLAFGYVDHPPLVAGAARVAAWLGGSLLAHRLLAIGAGVGVMALVAALARRMGGGGAAMTLAAFAAAVSPTYAFMLHYFSMNAVELLLAASFALSMSATLERPTPRRWALCGGILGIGVLTKYGLALLAASFFVSLLLLPGRRVLATKGFWICVVLALGLSLPHLAWQVKHGLPTLEFMHNARTSKNVEFSALGFIAAQVADMGPANAPIWGLGLQALLRGRISAASTYRTWGLAYVLLGILFIATGGKPYYLMVAYPPLIAAGSVVCERWALRARGARVGLAVVAYAGLALVVLPMGLPILPKAALLPYAAVLGGATPKQENGRLAELPQHYADMFGWQELAQTVSSVVDGLDDHDRAGAVVLAANYGEASAIEVLGNPGLTPRVTSPHNAYFTWGPPVGSPVIAVGFPQAQLEQWFDQVELVATHRCQLCMPREDQLPIHLCRRPRVPLASVWETLKVYR